MGKYNFDKIIERRGTSSLKYDFGPERMGRDDLMPLWVADMDFALPDEILDVIRERVDHGIFGYTDPDAAYFEAVKGWFGRHYGWRPENEWITVTPGVVYAIAVAVRAFTKPGDSVIIQEPVYYPFRETIEMNGRRCISSDLVLRSGRYEIDFEDFERKIADNDVKAFILCSPHNPAGRVWSREELQRLCGICIAHNVIVIDDEIHCDFIYPGHEFVPLASLGEKYLNNAVVATSPSKTFNIAGLQVANTIIADEKLRRTFRFENAAGGYSQGNAVGMTACRAVYESGDQWLSELIDYLAENVDLVRKFVRERLPGITLIEPEGTYLLWLDCSGAAEDYEDLRHLVVDEARLWLDDGIIFGKKTEMFERINIACPRKILVTALSRLEDAVEARAAG